MNDSNCDIPIFFRMGDIRNEIVFGCHFVVENNEQQTMKVKEWMEKNVEEDVM